MPNSINRVYPIRFNKKKWKIPLFCNHICNENCNIVIFLTEQNEYIILNNPDYKNNKCSFYNKLIPTTIKLSSFDINNSNIDNGILYNSDKKVIDDNSFILTIHFPLSNYFEVIISTPSENNGFTLKELIYSIKNLYELIYEGENDTATPQNFNLKKICTSCGNKNLDDFITSIDTITENITDDCCICYSDFTNNDDKYAPIKLKCGHIYHKYCINKWIDTTPQCPMCRGNVFQCVTCNGQGIIYYTFTGIVVPIEERGLDLNRNYTNGIFGIHTYDIEDLLIKNLIYDRKKKRLFMDITA